MIRIIKKNYVYLGDSDGNYDNANSEMVMENYNWRKFQCVDMLPYLWKV
jgi:hypothetical protein